MAEGEVGQARADLKLAFKRIGDLQNAMQVRRNAGPKLDRSASRKPRSRTPPLRGWGMEIRGLDKPLATPSPLSHLDRMRTSLTPTTQPRGHQSVHAAPGTRRMPIYGASGWLCRRGGAGKYAVWQCIVQAGYIRSRHRWEWPGGAAE